ncbi:Altered inheritance of mitochondria protein 32 [Aspergillus hancockii]|nr:Altered inheritance of mitochondria protein 32 [Aspergillus hancockii]
MFRSLLTFTKLAAPEYIFPTVDPKIDGQECLQDCSDCTVRWPSKVKVDTTLPMYGFIKEFHTHVLVATGKTDWIGKVEQEKGSLMEAFKSDAGKSKHGVVLTYRRGLVRMTMLFFFARINDAMPVVGSQRR